MDSRFTLLVRHFSYGLPANPLIFYLPATGATFIALLLAIPQNITATLIASLASFFAAFLTLIAFAIDIALFAYVKHKVGTLPDVQGKTTTSAGKLFP